MDDLDLSRAVSHALRHEPWSYELELDHDGWVDLDLLVDALRRDARWREVTTDRVRTMVATAPKQRHEVRDGRIRARYGHSLPGRLSLTPADPPPRLYHGTSRDVAATIVREGLRPMGRQYVHLSYDVETALAVGRRKDAAPVVLQVLAAQAAADGVRFYVGNDKVWLADEVPPAHLRSHVALPGTDLS